MTTATPHKEKTFPTDEAHKLPRPFILRRLHSFLGLWLVVYLFEHLLVNSQAAFLLTEGGGTFVSMVNKIHDLSYLKVIEVLFIAAPFLFHGIWGILYALRGKLNSFPTTGVEPSLPQYKRNRAYSWQRITSWLLIVGILGHVIQMRFLENPTKGIYNDKDAYFIPVNKDPGLERVAKRLGATILDEGEDKFIAAAPSAGAAFLINVRQTFTNPLMVILYTLLVIFASYHAFNGLWTSMIKWGITLTRLSQKRMRSITTALMGIVMFLGLISIWGTYFSTWLHHG